MTDIGGSVEAGFEGVAAAFQQNFVDHGEVGAATSVYVGGHKVVDLWGGVADAATGAPYTEDSLQLVFSTTKGATAACIHLLAQRGDLDIDAPVATYWPEFKAAGKADIPVRWLLCHKAGLPYVDGTMTLEDALAWDPVIRALEAQAPIWEPGTAHGYHATTYGWLLGELVRRVSGKSIGRFFADEFATPLDLDFWIGLPEAEQHRVAPLITMDGARGPRDARADGTVHGPRDHPRQGAQRSGGRASGDGPLQRPAGARRGDPGRQRRHQRPFPRSLLRRPVRHRRGRAGRAACSRPSRSPWRRRPRPAAPTR